MPSTGRMHDIVELYKLLETESNPDTRSNIMRTIQIIKSESGAIGSMRERLLRAHRAGEIEEIKDIHDYIKGKSKYGQ